MLLRTFLIGFLVFGLFVSVFGTYWFKMSDDYGVTVGENYLDSYGVYGETVEMGNDMAEQMKNSGADEAGSADIAGSLTRSSFSVVKMIFNTFSTIETVLTDILSRIGIENAGLFLGVAYSSIIIVITFIIASGFLQNKI